MSKPVEDYGKRLAQTLRRDPFSLPVVVDILISPHVVKEKGPEFADAAQIAETLFDSYQRGVVLAFVREMLRTESACE
jgi:hypothetical protein